MGCRLCCGCCKGDTTNGYKNDLEKLSSLDMTPQHGPNTNLDHSMAADENRDIQPTDQSGKEKRPFDDDLVMEELDQDDLYANE